MSPAVELVDAAEVAYFGRDESRLRIGLLLPLTGAMGMAGPSALDGAMLAAHEVNTARGRAGRPIQLVVADAGAPDATLLSVVDALACAGTVDALVGFHTSDVLERVERVVGGRVPYIFTPPHEGAERAAGVFCLGEGPLRQVAPAVDWLAQTRDIRNWALLGNDYVWPRAMHAAAVRAIRSTGGEVALNRLVPLGDVASRASEVIDAIDASGANGVLLSLVGRDLASFNAALRSSGLDARLVRLSGSLEENGLLAFGGDDTGGLYATMHSFTTLGTERHRELMERYRSLFGADAPVFDSYAEGCYDGVHLIAALDAAGRLKVDDLAESALGLLAAVPSSEWDTSPLGPRRDAVHLAAAQGLEFAVVADL
jgi:ABC-type branched-subunit amino acid transport system substrate-binding protein